MLAWGHDIQGTNKQAASSIETIFITPSMKENSPHLRENTSIACISVGCSPTLTTTNNNKKHSRIAKYGAMLNPK